MVHIKIELRDLPRLLQLIWELRQLEHHLRVAARPEADDIERILDRYFADVDQDLPPDEA